MSGGPYPVMVWFHGGGYTSSANIQYPGYFLASRDVVVVVTNYRLGIFGFGSTGDDVAPGNYGMWDQHYALNFVQENIANFGGDPNQVTIFGQSAGASSSGLHMVSPQSQGLFHKAIYHSGNELTLWSLNYPESNPEDFIRQVARNNSCENSEDSQAVIDCLRQLSADDLYENSSFDCAPGYFCMGFAPVVDGENGFMPKEPQELRDEGSFAKVPLLAGQCNKDGSLYTIAFIPEADEGGFNRTEFLDIVRNRLVDYFAPRLDSERTVEDVFQAINFFYTPWPNTEDLDANRQAFNDMITDVGFGYTGDVVYKSQAEEADVYQYVLAYRSAEAAELIPEWLGVPHNGELPYVWGYPLMQLNPTVRRESEMFLDLIDWDELDIAFAEYMQDLWANFAKYGNPTPEPVAAPDGSQTEWKKFTADDQNYLYINNTMEYRKDYNQQNFAFWREYMGYITGLETVFSDEAVSQLENPRDERLIMRSDFIEKSTYNFFAELLANALFRK